MVNWTAVRGPAGRMKQAMGYVLMIIDTLIQYAKTSKNSESGGVVIYFVWLSTVPHCIHLELEYSIRRNIQVEGMFNFC